MKRVLLTVFMIFALTILMSSTVFAYNYDDYTIDDEGDWYVTDEVDPDCQVTLYMLLKPDLQTLSNYGIYEFLCTDGDFPDDWEEATPSGIAYMMFKFMPANKDVYMDLDSDYQIWKWTFGIENGTYTFDQGTDDMGCTTLDSSLTYTPGESESVTLNNEDINLYCFYGSTFDEDPDALLMLEDFATEMENESNLSTAKENASSVETIEEPNTTSDSTVTITETTDDTTTADTTTADISTDTISHITIKEIAAIVILAIMGFYIAKTKKKKK